MYLMQKDVHGTALLCTVQKHGTVLCPPRLHETQSSPAHEAVFVSVSIRRHEVPTGASRRIQTLARVVDEERKISGLAHNLPQHAFSQLRDNKLPPGAQFVPRGSAVEAK